MLPAIIGAASNIFGTLANNIFASEREENARQQNFDLNERAADYADARTRALYADLQSPKALLEQYKDAGLSPSLMFGGGGVGGQTAQGAQGAGASGISPTTYGLNFDPNTLADIELKKAEARKANAEAARQEGTGKMGELDFQNLLGENNYIQLKNEATEWDNTRRSLEVNLLATYGEQEITTKLENLDTNTKALKEQIRKLKVEGNIAEKTENTVIERIEDERNLVAANVLKTRAEKLLIDHQIPVTDKQLENLASLMAFRSGIIRLQDEKIFIDWQAIRNQAQTWTKELDLKQKDLELQMYKGIKDLIFETIDEAYGMGMFDKPRNKVGFN